MTALVDRLEWGLVPAVPVPFRGSTMDREAQRGYARWMAGQPVAGANRHAADLIALGPGGKAAMQHLVRLVEEKQRTRRERHQVRELRGDQRHRVGDAKACAHRLGDFVQRVDFAVGQRDFVEYRAALGSLRLEPDRWSAEIGGRLERQPAGRDILERLGFARRISVPLAFILVLSPIMLAASLRQGRSPDPLSILVMAAGAYFIVARRPWALAVTMLVGVANRESALFLVPLAYALWADRWLDRRALLRVIAASVPAENVCSQRRLGARSASPSSAPVRSG